MLITISGFIISVALLIFLTVKLRWPSFLALLTSSYCAGLIFGLSPEALMTLVMEGFGVTLRDIGLTVALGALLGFILEYSGATISIANGVVRLLGGRFPALALAITGYIVSIPIYCDSGFIILNSIRKHLVKTHKVSPVFLSTVLGTALYATHTLVPPTPGPLAAAANLQISDHLPLVMLSGMAVSVVALVVGFLWGLYSQRYEVKEGPFERKAFLDKSEAQRQAGFFVSFLPVLAPILLITVSGLVGKGEDGIAQWLVFFGQPANALLVGLACCWPLVSKSPQDGLEVYMAKGLEAGGKIALIVGCGGAFGLVLRASDFSELLTSNEALVGFGLFLPFLMAAIIKTSEGMATVALITSSALIEPLLPLLGLDSVTGRLLALLACGGGSMTVAHVNDSFFWVIAEFSGMDTMTALKSITVATFLQGASVLITVQILGWWLL